MSHEINPDPIGVPVPIEPNEGRRILKRLVTLAVVSVGGVLAFAVLMAPTQCRGATRSARLKWQERQSEIERALGTSSMAETNDAASTAEEEPTNPAH